MRSPARQVHFPEDVPTLTEDGLTEGGLTLRALSEADLPYVIEQCRDPETARWTTVPSPYGIAEARAYLEQVVAAGWRDGTQAGFSIVAEIDGQSRYCGQVDIRFGPHAMAEVGFVLHPAARGRGIMARAVRMAALWAFTTRHTAVIRWYAALGNWPSLRVAQAVGFVYEGVGRARAPLRDGLADGWMASLVPEDLLSAP